MKTIKLLQQGDVLLKKLDQYNGATPPLKKQSVVLAHGEVTGHTHTLTGLVSDVFTSPYITVDGRFGPCQIIAVGSPAVFTHDEHNAFDVEDGVYVVDRVRVYDPFERAMRLVND